MGQVDTGSYLKSQKAGIEKLSGLTTPGALGAIQLAGATLAVEISNLLAGGFQT